MAATPKIRSLLIEPILVEAEALSESLGFLDRDYRVAVRGKRSRVESFSKVERMPDAISRQININLKCLAGELNESSSHFLACHLLRRGYGARSSYLVRLRRDHASWRGELKSSVDRSSSGMVCLFHH
jgi:hypothetical protein